MINNFKPSHYQSDIFNWVVYGKGNCIVTAVAGSGKSKTLQESIKLIPNEQKLLVLAFNVSIAEELRQKIDRPKTDIKTLHSLGYAFIRGYYKPLKLNINPDEYKYHIYLKENLYTLRLGVCFSNRENEKTFKENCIKLCDYGRLFLAQTLNDMHEIANKYNIIYVDNEAEIALQMMEWGRESIRETETIDFIDMIYLPVVLDMKVPYLKYDFVMIDEIQDLSIVQQELFKKTFKRGSRFIGFGDKKQAIYGFAGSNELSFDTLCKTPNTIQLPLSLSYRCSKKVGELAKTFVPEFEVRENAVEGSINYGVKVKEIIDGDMVICRNTAPLVKLYMNLISENKKAFIKGKDIGDNLIRMVERCDKPNLSKNLTRDGVFIKLYEQLFDARNQLMIHKKLDKDEASMSDKICKIYDNIKALETLSIGLDTSFDLMKRIETIFTNENKNGIMLSTIHKAKGLESDNVYIACPSLIPASQAKEDWEIEQENNLEYVAYTRAKINLNFICEKDFSPNINMTLITSELDTIEVTINSVLENGVKPIEIETIIEVKENKNNIKDNKPTYSSNVKQPIKNNFKLLS